jgi:predicted hydrocarbon binding protein
MNRAEFFRSCAGGVCACGSLAALARTAEAQADDKQVAALKQKVDAMQTRFALLAGILNQNVDVPTRKKIFQALGKECAKTYSTLTTKYKNDLPGFLAEGRRQWMESAEYDQAAGTIRIVDRSRTCTCPLVKQGSTPPGFCECTLGWQKEAYSSILGKPVEVELEESILRGGTKCVFRIRVV